MSLVPSLDVKEQVKQATDIVDLVSAAVPLRRQGRNYVGICPWHDDSHPSLQVNPERQSFRCYVCNLGGDVFSFVMQLEGVDFAEALTMLAERAGIALRRTPRPAAATSAGPAAPGGPAADSSDKQTLYRTMAWAERQYHHCLTKLPEGEPGRAYLRDRGITDASIGQFHLGYSPDAWDWILRRAADGGPSPALLEAVGIATRSAGGTGRHYDRFRGRVLFSIRDSQARPVGLGGRVLPGAAGDNPAKYVNSPETPLFSKSKLLYGLDVARDGIRRAKSVMVMEGYTDCILAQQCGFANAVAVLGTALGEEHVRVLRRFADRVLLILDGDAAGQKRAAEVLELFVAQQVDLRIVTLPEEADPCEFLLEHGAEAFRDLVETRAVDALEHAFQTHTRGLDVFGDLHGASEALERLLAIVAKAPRQRADTTRDLRLREELLLGRLAARFRISEDEIRRRLRDLRQKNQSTRRPAAKGADAAADARIDPCDRALLELLICHAELWARAAEGIGPEQIASPRCRQIFEGGARLALAGQPLSFEVLMLSFDDPALKTLIVELDEEGQAKGCGSAAPAALLEDLINQYARREALKRRPAQTATLREGRLDPEAELRLLDRLVQQERARQGISSPRKGEDAPDR